jgi:hypothetical protein
MHLFKRIAASLSGIAPQNDLAISYPSAALNGTLKFHSYPPKVLLEDQRVFADLVMGALASQFQWPIQGAFQEGKARQGDKAVHFSIRRQFGGSVVVMVTNSIELIEKIDSLDLQPPPPWVVFPHADPRTFGSLQGSMEYWWGQLFSPFWNTLDSEERASYLGRYCAHPEWADFLSSRAQ